MRANEQREYPLVEDQTCPVPHHDLGPYAPDGPAGEEEARLHLQALAHVGRMQSMDEMASILAHELNQPLTAILSFSQATQRVVKKQDFDHEELIFTLNRIALNAKRASDIMNTMRRFFRKEEPDIISTDVNRLVRDTIELVQPELRQLEVDVEYSLYPSLPRACIDPIQIQQVVLNLVRNSMEALAEQNAGLRHIAITTQFTRKRFVEVTIADSGPGLDPDVVGKIFEAFVTTKAEGIGIGLSICKSFIEAYGGTLFTRSVEQPGATVGFELPTAGGGGWNDS